MFAQKKQTAIEVGSIKGVKLSILDPDLYSWRDTANQHTVVLPEGDGPAVFQISPTFFSMASSNAGSPFKSGWNRSSKTGTFVIKFI